MAHSNGDDGGKDWIAGAVKHPGSFKAAAEKAGKSTATYAKENLHAKSALGKKARLAYTLMGLHGDGKSSDKKPGDGRTPAHKLYQVG